MSLALPLAQVTPPTIDYTGPFQALLPALGPAISQILPYVAVIFGINIAVDVILHVMDTFFPDEEEEDDPMEGAVYHEVWDEDENVWRTTRISRRRTRAQVLAENEGLD